MDLSGQNILVTGGAGGIGIGICRRLHLMGANIAVHYFRSEAKAKELASDISGISVYADLTKKTEVKAMFGKLESEWGVIDSCVANAGRYPKESLPVWEIDEARWVQTLNANLKSSLFTSQEFLTRAVNRGRGSLVLISSTAGIYGEQGHADYAAAKGAITSGLLKTMKNDIAGSGVRVNAVAPGWTLTESRIEEGIDQTIAENAKRTMSIKKLATPNDVAAAVAFLLSEDSSGHISGQVIEVSGGMEGRVIPPLED